MLKNDRLAGDEEWAKLRYFGPDARQGALELHQQRLSMRTMREIQEIARSRLLRWMKKGVQLSEVSIFPI